MLGLAYPAGHQWGSLEDIDIDLVRWVNPELQRQIWREINKTLKYVSQDPIPLRVVTTALNSFNLALSTGITIQEIKGVVDQCCTEPAAILAGRTKAHEAIVEMIEAIAKEEGRESRGGLIYFMILAAIYNGVIETMDPLLMSIGFSAPYLTRDIKAQSSDYRKIRDTFVLCKIAMDDVIGYSPRVDNIEDVLRIRRDRSIIRFRECLSEWNHELPSGRDHVLKRIKSDIRKANKEFSRLEKWKRVDRWLLWIQIPAAFIPIVSNVVTFLGVGTQLYIARSEKKNSWQMLGR
jgi:hypothetical protein